MVDIYFESEGRQLRENANSHQNGAPPHKPRSVRSQLDEMFPIQWNEIYGSIRWPATSPNSTTWTLSAAHYLKNQVY